MNSMPVALFGDRAKAEPIKQRLDQAGFNTQINELPSLARLWFVPRLTADVRVEVPCDQFEPAAQLLLDWDAAEGALAQAIRCRECGSLRVDYPQFARHSLLTNLAMGILSQLRLVERNYYCEDCHYTWPKSETRTRRERQNLAPYYFIEAVEQTSRKAGREAAPQQRKVA